MYEPSNVLDEVVPTQVLGSLVAQIEPLTAAVDLQGACCVLQLNSDTVTGRRMDQQEVEHEAHIGDRARFKSDLHCLIELANYPSQTVLKVGFTVKHGVIGRESGKHVG
jgi:hypothetical protein